MVWIDGDVMLKQYMHKAHGNFGTGGVLGFSIFKGLKNDPRSNLLVVGLSGDTQKTTIRAEELEWAAGYGASHLPSFLLSFC